MDRPARIAVVGVTDDRMVGDLRQLPLRPEVRPFAALVADSEALARFQPDLLLIGLGPAASEEIGALRLLQHLWPAVAVIVVAAAADEVATAPLAARLRAQLLVYPAGPGQLAAAIEQARLQSDRPRPEVFLDLARGVADEINNPLQFVSGHLQLLRASFDAAQERDRRDQIAAALAGVARIEASIERLRLLSNAAGGPRQRETVDLAALIAGAVGARGEVPAATVARVTIAPGQHVVSGDRGHLAAAVSAIVRFADELVTAGATSQLHLDSSGDARVLVLTAHGQALASWQLPNTFEPYYPSRALRGHSPGLGLFLAQTVVLGHHGQATVRRMPQGGLQFQFVLPA